MAGNRGKSAGSQKPRKVCQVPITQKFRQAAGTRKLYPSRQVAQTLG